MFTARTRTLKTQQADIDTVEDGWVSTGERAQNLVAYCEDYWRSFVQAGHDGARSCIREAVAVLFIIGITVLFTSQSVEPRSGNAASLGDVRSARSRLLGLASLPKLDKPTTALLSSHQSFSPRSGTDKGSIHNDDLCLSLAVRKAAEGVARIHHESCTTGGRRRTVPFKRSGSSRGAEHVFAGPSGAVSLWLNSMRCQSESDRR